MRAFVVAADLLREAAARKWFLALGIGISLVLIVIASALRMEVVDGALAATRLFGNDFNTDIRAVDVALRPLFEAASYVVFYGGLTFGIVACADFGPALLAPGRIEHLLALPVRRWELLLGTYLGVWTLMALAALFGAGGFALILGIKTGVWSAAPLVAGLLGSVVFIAIYGAMLSAAVFVRSASVSALVGSLLFVGGIVASYRITIAEAFEVGWARMIFWGLTAPLPRVARIADLAVAGAGDVGLTMPAVMATLMGVAVFGFSAVAVGLWHFERKDF